MTTTETTRHDCPACDPTSTLPYAETAISGHRPTRQDAETDTLPQWLYQRFARLGGHAPAWSSLSDADRDFWAHEAAAVRRAVERGGFKATSGGAR